MLNGGISRNAILIAGHVTPHARLSTTSISFAVASVLSCCEAGTGVSLNAHTGSDNA